METYLLTENGNFLLQENGYFIVLNGYSGPTVWNTIVPDCILGQSESWDSAIDTWDSSVDTYDGLATAGYLVVWNKLT